MSEISNHFGHLSPLKQALLALEQMRFKLEKIEKQQTEPIAIIGMACRFPGGANDPDSFWQLLHNGVGAVREVPLSRWNVNTYYDPNPEVIGKMYTRQANFLEIGVDEFDADFFRLTPREVVSMDPQQRLLLEVSWEALENAGQAPDKLIGSQTGIFVGINNSDYSQLSMKSKNSIDLDAYYFTGNSFSVAAGRISYILGLQGPSISIDTACSSSLVTVHFACQSLRLRECSMALAGGVNLILSPEGHIVLSRMRALAADGCCKTFDAAADGYGRGEGCGIVVLKRLSDAIADNDNILALVRGSAVNHDGYSSGLTVPNGLSQQKLIRAALANAKVEPNQVSYVEVHGTGTALGDPIEVEALANVLSQGREESHPLMIGSVKTNIGHLEAAAGIAAIIKVLVAMQHKEIPPHLHLKNPNPSIPWKDLPIVIPTEQTPWFEKASQGQIAGISSFGMSGTNAHVVLEKPLAPSPLYSEVERPFHLFTLSAKSDVALKELANRFANYLKNKPLELLSDVCFTANIGRAHFVYRLALVIENTSQLIKQLTSFAKGETSDGLKSGLVPPTKPKVAFVFTNVGSDYINIGRQLYETQPTFRKTLQYCDELLRPYLQQPLLSVIYPEAGTTSLLNETDHTLPVLFAMEYALAQLWRSWGIEPAVVMGQGVGEYVAACIAGIFSLEDGLKLVIQQSKIMRALPLKDDTESLLNTFAQVAATIEYSSPRIRIISSLTGKLVEGKDIAQAKYWLCHIQDTVKLSDSIQMLQELGYELFVEINLHPRLSGIEQKCLQEATMVWLPSLRQGQSDWFSMLYSLRELYIRGVDVDWRGFDQDYQRRRRPLPTYPFQRQRYWLDLVSPLLNKNKQLDSFHDWLYQVQWQPKACERPNSASIAIQSNQRSCWLIFADRNHGLGSKLAGLLEERGKTCIMVFPGETYEIFGQKEWKINPEVPADFQKLLQAVLTTNQLICQGIVHLWSLDSNTTQFTTTDSLQVDQIRNCGSVLHLLQALSATKIDSLPRLWLVTQGAQPIELPTQKLAVAQTPILGLGRVVAAEHPELWGGLVDLDPSNFQQADAHCLEAILNSDGETEVAFRQGQRYVPRLVSSSSSKLQFGTLDLHSDCTYMLAGGLGGLGLNLTEWMVNQGARYLVLVGRSIPSEYAVKCISKLQNKGVKIVFAQADISQESEIQRVFTDISKSLPPLRGIIHLAGILDDGVLLKQNWERFAKVMNPKVAGAWNLHLLTQDMSLDFFVLFSSIASLIGSPGQGNYSAANAFLDALAHHRQLQGLPALSINWSPWGESGMAAGLGKKGENRWTDVGISVISLQQGLQVLEQLLSHSDAQINVLPVNWSKFLQQIPTSAKSPFFSEIVQQLPLPHPQHKLLEQLTAAPSKQRQIILVNYIQNDLAKVLGRDLSQLPDSQLGFFEMGMDSLMTLELKNRLQTSLGHSLPSTLTYEYPNITALAEYLLKQVLSLETSTVFDSQLKTKNQNQSVILSEIEQLSTNELEALINEELAALIKEND